MCQNINKGVSSWKQESLVVNTPPLSSQTINEGNAKGQIVPGAHLITRRNRLSHVLNLGRNLPQDLEWHMYKAFASNATSSAKMPSWCSRCLESHSASNLDTLWNSNSVQTVQPKRLEWCHTNRWLFFFFFSSSGLLSIWKNLEKQMPNTSSVLNHLPSHADDTACDTVSQEYTQNYIRFPHLKAHPN